MVFSRRYLIDGNREQGRAGGLADLAAQAAGQDMELGGGEVAHVPLADCRLDLVATRAKSRPRPASAVIFMGDRSLRSS